VNGIASFSFFDDRRWCTPTSAPSAASARPGRGPRGAAPCASVYGIVETFGQRSQTPTLHYGIRFWVIPNRFQIDATRGKQSADPEKRFFSVGLRFLF